MSRSTSPAHPEASPLYPGDSRRVVAETETAAVRIEEMVDSPGLCIARHSNDSASLIFIIAGVQWSGHCRGGDTRRPHTVGFLPGAQENYFPVESRCLQIELRQSIRTTWAVGASSPRKTGRLINFRRCYGLQQLKYCGNFVQPTQAKATAKNRRAVGLSTFCKYWAGIGFGGTGVLQRVVRSSRVAFATPR